MDAVDTQLHDAINSGLTRWWLAVWMDAVAESKRKERNPRVSTRFSLGLENERVDARGDGRTCLARPFIFPAKLSTSRISDHNG